MKLEVKHESSFKLEKIYVKSFSFKRPIEVKELSLSFGVKRNLVNIASEDELNKAEVHLIANIVSEDSEFELVAEIVGVFEIEDENLNAEFKKSLFEKNAVSILFPYLRSQVTLLTSQPDLKPIVIPPININQMLEEHSN